MSRPAAERLVIEAVQAYEHGNLELSLGLYRESLAIWIELYKASIDNASKSELYSILQQNMTRAENIKNELEKKAQIPITTTPPSLTNNSNAPKNDSKSTSCKVVSNLPDNHDYTSARKAKSSKASSAAAKSDPHNNKQAFSPKPVRKAPIPVQPKSSVSSKDRVTADSSEVNGKSSKLDEYMSQIMDEIVDRSPAVRWDDIAGLQFAKQTLQEAVILPNLRPDIFTGLRSPPKGVLLFGPPGTGKTLLAKAVATESGFTFFSISAASVTSKYLGEGEKLMRALFEIAREKQPCVIFFDEIDALMSARKDNEHEASRRLKTEFMTQIDGATSSSSDRILIMGATNLPWDLDEAVLRRMPKRIYVPLPDPVARKSLITHLLDKQGSGGSKVLRDTDIEKIVRLTDGYSGSDLSAVCHEAALGPIREVSASQLRTIKPEDVRPIQIKDFENAVQIIRPSVSNSNLQQFQKWSDTYGVTR